MTTEAPADWRELEAGPELDALVAEQIMSLGPSSPAYSSPTGPVGEVVMMMRKRGYRFAIYTVVPTNLDLPPDRWAMAVTFTTGHEMSERGGSQLSGEEESLHHNLSRAVCLAALRAVNP